MGEVRRKAVVGERVRIVYISVEDAECDFGYNVGDEFIVKSVEHSGEPNVWPDDDPDAEIFLWDEEYVVITEGDAE